jgi:hypothetical protein
MRLEPNRIIPGLDLLSNDNQQLIGTTNPISSDYDNEDPLVAIMIMKIR